MEPFAEGTFYTSLPSYQPRAWLQLVACIIIRPRSFGVYVHNLSKDDADKLARYALAPALTLLYLPISCLVVLASLLNDIPPKISSKPEYLRSWLDDATKWTSENLVLVLVVLCIIWITVLGALYLSRSNVVTSHPIVWTLFSFVAYFMLFIFFAIIVSPVLASFLMNGVWISIILGLVTGVSTSIAYPVSQLSGRYATVHWTAVALGLGASTIIGVITVASPGTAYSLDGVRVYSILYFTLLGTGMALWYRVDKQR